MAGSGADLARSWRWILGLAGALSLGYAGVLAWRGGASGTVIAFVAAASALLVVSAVGRMPSSIKYKETSIDWSVTEVVDRMADVMDPSQLKRAADSLTLGDVADPSGRTALPRVLWEYAAYGESVLAIVRRVTATLGLNLDEQVSGWDAAVRVGDECVNFEMRLRLDDSSAKRIVERIRTAPEGESVVVVSRFPERSAVRILGSAAGRAHFIEDRGTARIWRRR